MLIDRYHFIRKWSNPISGRTGSGISLCKFFEILDRKKMVSSVHLEGHFHLDFSRKSQYFNSLIFAEHFRSPFRCRVSTSHFSPQCGVFYQGLERTQSYRNHENCETRKMHYVLLKSPTGIYDVIHIYYGFGLSEISIIYEPFCPPRSFVIRL